MSRKEMPEVAVKNNLSHEFFKYLCTLKINIFISFSFSLSFFVIYMGEETKIKR